MSFGEQFGFLENNFLAWAGSMEYELIYAFSLRLTWSCNLFGSRWGNFIGKNGDNSFKKVLTFLLCRTLWICSPPKVYAKREVLETICTELYFTTSSWRKGQRLHLTPLPHPVFPRHSGSFSSSNQAHLFLLRLLALALSSIFLSLILII